MATVGSEESKTEKLKEAELANENNSENEDSQLVAKTIREMDVKWLEVSAKVGDWHEEEEGKPPPPFHCDKYWEVKIDVHTGFIKDWPKGTTADLCYKVSDRGYYALTDEKGNTLLSKDGYVPPCLGDKYGDYIEMEINEDGQIQGWNFNLNDCIKNFKNFSDSDSDDDS